MAAKSARWTHPSVLGFAGENDPIEAMTSAARDVVLRALDNGWVGPPFDPLSLADQLKLPVVPRDDVDDARTVPLGSSAYRIEFNPNRPRGRLRYSVAHEIAHTFFSDCGERVRNRLAHSEATGDDWQLEALCNIGAAEILMPMGVLPRLEARDLGVDNLMSLRKRFDVSTEALFIRVVRLTAAPCAVFCASRIESGARQGAFRIDYIIKSRTGGSYVPRGSIVSAPTVLSECTAIGYTSKCTETWADLGQVHVECVGIPPYPGARHPRIIGILTDPRAKAEPQNAITYLKGSAVDPRGDGPRLVVHLVNDATANWGGGGFAQAVRKRMPWAYDEYREWAEQTGHLVLGNVHFSSASAEQIAVATVIGQKGYGPSTKPRIRYAGLRDGLQKITHHALQEKATLHMARIGCGQAGGSWEIVEELLDATLVAAGLRVFVYDLPDAEYVGPPQAAFGFGPR